MFLNGEGYMWRFPHRFRLLTTNLLNDLKARTMLKIYEWASNFLVKARRRYTFLWGGRKLVAVFWIKQFWVIYLEKKNSNCNNRIMSSSSWSSKTWSSWMFMIYTPLENQMKAIDLLPRKMHIHKIFSVKVYGILQITNPALEFLSLEWNRYVIASNSIYQGKHLNKTNKK